MKNNKKINLKKAIGSFALTLILCVGHCACNDENKIEEYNPNASVTLDDFYPKTGSMLEGIIISGSNFGSDPKKIKVYFNKKPAIVTGASGGRIQALAPRLPGDICDISVVIGKDSVIFKDKYKYLKNYNLSIVAGQPNSTTDVFVEGTLSQTQFLNNLHFMTIDPQDILYASQNKGGDPIILVNETQNYTRLLLKSEGSGTTNSPMGGTYEPKRKKLAIMSGNNGYFWEVDPYNPVDWIVRKLLRPTSEQIAMGYVNPTNSIEWFYSPVYTEYTRPGDPLRGSDEGFLYTRTSNGMLVRFKMSNQVMDMVTHQCPTGKADTYITGDPDDNTKIYCSQKQNHRISVIDLTKAPNEVGFETNIIGLPGAGGHADGHVSIARLKEPQQIAVTKDMETGKKIMYIADSKNNCVRKYDFETQIVSTIAGTPGKQGLEIGNPEKSLMKEPYGLVVNSQGDLYISDKPNRIILKLAFQ